MRFQVYATGVLFGVCVVGLGGCNRPGVEDVAYEEEHAHDEEGPHGGHIVELGAPEHHAELTHDEATHKVGIHLVGEDAKTVAPIEAQKVTINVAADGQPSQYELPAVPQAGETGGKSSYFEIVSEPLCKIVSGESEAKSTQARLSLDIDGERYVGIIETAPHNHDHAHGHDGEHADEGEHKDEHAEEHKDEPAVEPQAEPAEVAPTEPAEEPADAPADEPVVEPADEPAAEPVVDPADE